MELLLDSVRRSAARAGWSEIYFNATSKVVSFKKASYSARINVYYSTGTVGTCIDHPRQGKTQLFRRNVDLVMLNTIFDDPRVHTDRGYQRNRNNPPPPRRSEAHPAAISQAWGEGGGQLGGGGGGEPALQGGSFTYSQEHTTTFVAPLLSTHTILSVNLKITGRSSGPLKLARHGSSLPATDSC